MLKTIRFSLASVLLIAAIFTGCSFHPDLAETLTSQILYTQIDNGPRISAWLYNLDKDIKIKIGDDFWARGWSPSGEKILLDGDGQNKPGQIWVCSNDGKNQELVFNINDHQDILFPMPVASLNSIQVSFWLTDSIILVQFQDGPMLIYDIEQKSILRIVDATVVDVSTTGEYWIERQRNTQLFSLSSLHDKPVELPQYGPSYYAFRISPDGTKIVHSVSREGGILLVISDIGSGYGMKNETTIAPIPSRSSNFQWSPDGSALLYGYYDSYEEQIICIVVGIPNGDSLYSQPCTSKVSFDLRWSPRSDGFITQSSLQEYIFYRFDGTTSPILSVESGSIQIIDWRLVSTP